MTTALENTNIMTQIRDNVEQLRQETNRFHREVTEFRTHIELLRADMEQRFDRPESPSDPMAKRPRSAPANGTPTRA